MFDLGEGDLGFDAGTISAAAPRRGGLAKSAFDLCVCLALLPILAMAALILILINPFLNHGPLIFAQRRMGRDCRPFTAYKFRTMAVASVATRGAFDPLEADRIGRFGGFLRRTRIDELPQILNVLRGEMSLIGPRPDAYDHAGVYLQEVPGYAARYQVIPGISGFAQTEVGYVDGLADMQRKVAADHYYLQHASLRLDLWIAWRTLCVVLGAKGA